MNDIIEKLKVLKSSTMGFDEAIDMAIEAIEENGKLTNKIILLQDELLKSRADGWISVEDRLPEEYMAVALVDNTSMCYRGSFNQLSGWQAQMYEMVKSKAGKNKFNIVFVSMTDGSITHWQPLPSEVEG